MSATLEEDTVTKDLLEFWCVSEPIIVLLGILASVVFDYPQRLKHENLSHGLGMKCFSQARFPYSTSVLVGGI